MTTHRFCFALFLRQLAQKYLPLKFSFFLRYLLVYEQAPHAVVDKLIAGDLTGRPEK